MNRVLQYVLNPFFFIGLGMFLVGVALIFFGDAPVYFYGAIIEQATSDGRCTGFPNGVGNWQWGDCCQAHDIAGTTGGNVPQSDVALASCIISRVPEWAAPLCLFGVALMGFGRPCYNLAKRVSFGWIK